jgi:ferredoxin
MGTGPAVVSGFDLVLTEVLEGARHYFVLRGGSDEGRSILERIDTRAATDPELAAESGAVAQAAESMGRRLEREKLPELLDRSAKHPHWDDVARRCLACANCTMVCPTCFCHTVEDTIDLTGENAERWRSWDSCFSGDHSFIHGGRIRASIRGRYRQWLTHKLGTWHEQFGTSGCVGCGRCITWCPVGIDLTAEVRALREGCGAAVEEDSP